MREARASASWHRTGLLTAFGVLLLAATNQGCSSDDTKATATGATSSSTTTSSSSGTGGSGGEGTGGTGGGNTGEITAEECATTDQFTSPFDATPDPDGGKFFFTAIDKASGDTGIFAGCSPVTAVHVGTPLVAPFGIATGTDGSMLYVADSAYESANGGIGTLWTLPAAGGALTSLVAAEGFAPRGLEVLAGAEGDEVLFTGRSPADGQPGLFKLVSGAVTTVAKGAPFVEPSGVAIVDANMMFVTDTDGSGDGLGAVIMVMGGTASVLASGIGVGYPAGIAVTASGNTVLVSGIDPSTKRDVVYLIDVTTKAITTYNDTIGANVESAGLHRAKNSDVFAWADLSAGATGGTVYKITLK